MCVPPVSMTRELKKKKSKGARRLSGSPKHQRSTGGSVAVVRSNSATTESLQQSWAWDAAYAAFGLTLACYLGYLYATHAKQLHENELWFSHISPLEREISFRTEAGLYYSYYKQLVEAPSLLEGLSSLIHDNQTESMRTINVLRRFNVLQEVLLATLYRWLPIKHLVEPVYFYIDVVFGLHGAYLAALICTAWLLSGSILGGGLAFLFYLFNRADATRVVFAVPLRESFALPFVAAQVLCTTLYLHRSSNPVLSKLQAASLWLVFLSSLCVAVSWQFAQFVFLLQGCALFATQVLGLAPTRKVWNLLLSHAAALLVAHVLQFFNLMLLGSPALAFTGAAGAVFLAQRWLEGQGDWRRSRSLVLVRIAGSTVSVLVITVALCGLFKRLLCISEDDHIFKFVLAKLGLVSPLETRDFDSLLYLCQVAFQPLPLASLSRLASSLLLPCYLLTAVGLLGLTGRWVLWGQHTTVSMECPDSSLPGHRDLSKMKPISRTESDSSGCSDASSSADTCSSGPETTNPAPIPSEWAYVVLLSLLFALVALSARRFCYLWVPQACVVAAAGVGSSHAWRAGLEKLGASYKMGRATHLLGVSGLIAALLLRELPGLLQELNQLREFYDPDTVQLMQWIISETPRHAVFAGSMQLLSGVKLCTGRSVTNHPHFENKELRERTLQVYQLYARQSPEHLHRSLALLGTDYIILEDSICLARQKPDNHNCTLPDIMDIVNGHNPGTETLSDSSPSQPPRFCDAARHGRGQYSKYFKGVFENRTFRVYRLNPKSKPVQL